jgi:hypothetical protein
MTSFCSTCEGRKHVLGFGGMKKDCPDCNGTGRVLPESDDKLVENVDLKVDKRSKEYRGSKKSREA